MPAVIMGVVINRIIVMIVIGIMPVRMRIPDKAPVRLVPGGFPPWIIINYIIPVRRIKIDIQPGIQIIGRPDPHRPMNGSIVIPGIGGDCLYIILIIFFDHIYGLPLRSRPNHRKRGITPIDEKGDNPRDGKHHRFDPEHGSALLSLNMVFLSELHSKGMPCQSEC
jgi:hypothetical protein